MGETQSIVPKIRKLSAEKYFLKWINNRGKYNLSYFRAYKFL